MATAALTEVRNWFDTPKAAKVIAQIKPADFAFDFCRNFITSGGERQWLPNTGFGFAVEADLDDLRAAFIADLVGFQCDENTAEAQMDEWIAADRLQATVAEVIAAAIRQRGHLGWTPPALSEAEMAELVAGDDAADLRAARWEASKAHADAYPLDGEGAA